MKFKVEISFAVESPIHTTGDRLSFGIDKALYVDPRNGKDPSIPATSIKGWLRFQTEAVLNTAGNRKSCHAPSPDKMCHECQVCKYFGSPKIKSPLLFHDALIKETFVNPRIGVGIGRQRKTAKEDFLFSLESAYGKEIIAEIDGVLGSWEDALEAIALLYLGAKGNFTLGGSRTRGLGWVKFKDFKAFIEEEEVPEGDIENKVREILIS